MGVDAGHDACIDEAGDRAWVVHRRRVEPGIAPVRLAKELHELDSDPSDRRAERGDSLQHRRRGERLVSQIQADHRQRPAGCENNRGRLGINVDIEFRSRCRIAPRIGTTHEDDLLDFLDDPWLFA